ncbi:MAG: hypothetical protein A2898_02345 [Candidatus Kerfeldbacteria bacterium RIFCSPLOWO2_01_FULL_48_11]|uniref:Uncharacterized protein n=1 Tax=Candidatus Kerfeldbacteria bacterium RIFCSPLOWO2_01_FULL_48_11 TaxID=1798543 RepID=A0A1G2B4E4_9BACT|nr:MAG: hypothetical protein A2898_02345 [Candidatus Kerfeldbacteria bacterium RIFCSPLOWO2_01_FULL_48_11]HCM68621.1 hypothetical protein [Candidatus Kerfeldbacteria bacterium]
MVRGDGAYGHLYYMLLGIFTGKEPMFRTPFFDPLMWSGFGNTPPLARCSAPTRMSRLVTDGPDDLLGH